MRFAIDSNILVYAATREDGRKHEIAREIMLRAPELDCVLPVQVVAEFLNVIRRRDTSAFELAEHQASRWMRTLPIVETAARHVLAAASFARRHKLQLWDCIIWQAAVSAGASFFISEDLQDGLSLDGMTVINPFHSPNEEALRTLLRSED